MPILFVVNAYAQNYTGISIQYAKHFQAIQFFNGEVMKHKDYFTLRSISDAGRVGLSFLKDEKFGFSIYGGGADYGHHVNIKVLSNYGDRFVITHIKNKFALTELVPSYSSSKNGIMLTHRVYLQFNLLRYSRWISGSGSRITDDSYEFGFRTGYAFEIGKLNKDGIYTAVLFNIFAPNLLFRKNTENFSNPDLNSMSSSYGISQRTIYMNQIPIGIGFHITPFFNYHKRKESLNEN